MIQQVHLVIPEICDNTTTFVDKESLIWDQGVLLLNKLTPFVSLYQQNEPGTCIAVMISALPV